MYDRITMNLMPGPATRRETLEGKQYLVVPAVMMTPGVHTGNQGPKLYLPEELSKTPSVWNYKPVTLYHPTVDGEGVSACDVGVIERQKIGLIMNTSYDDKLKNECWLDEPKMRGSAEGLAVVNAINEGKMVELSTGLFHDPQETPGVWNGKAYGSIVRNIRPDHLAILPDQKGACSIADGAGLLRNADGDELSHEDIRDQLRTLLKATGSPIPCNGEDDYCWVQDVFPKYAIAEKGGRVYKIGYKVRKGKVSIVEGEPEEVRKVTTYVTANGQTMTITTHEDHQGPIKSTLQQPPHVPTEGELSDVMKRQQLDSSLKTKYSGVQQEGDWGGWTTQLFANFAIFSKDGKIFRLPYTYDDDKINFGDMAEVVKVSEYKDKKDQPIDGTQSPQQVSVLNQTGITMATQPIMNQTKKQIIITGTPEQLNKIAQNAMHEGAHALFHDPHHHDAHQEAGGKSDSQVRTTVDGARKKEVDAMIAGGHATEAQRSELESLPDDHFKSVHSFVTKGATMPIVPYTYEGIGDRSNAPGGGTHNQQQMTTEQFLAVAPPEIRDLVVNHRQREQALRAKCIQIITNRSKFNPAWLATQPTGMLKTMAQMAAGPQAQQPTQNYSGQAGDVPMFVEPQASGDVIQNGQIVQNAEDDILYLPGGGWGDDAQVG